MAEIVVGYVWGTDEVVVRDTETGDMWTTSGTQEQVDEVSQAIAEAGDYGTIEEIVYEEPTPETIATAPVPPPEEIEVFIAPEGYAIFPAPPEEIYEPSLVVTFMSLIVERLNDISDFFYSLYLEVLGWVYPFWLAASFFYNLTLIFNRLAWDFTDFAEWVIYTTDRLGYILSWSTIWSYILSYVPNLADIRDWFYYWWSNVFGVVLDWWSSTQYTVRAWIDEAVLGVRTLVDQANTWLATLQTAWDDFKGRIPTIDNVIYWWSNWTGNVTSVIDIWWTSALTEVQGLIDSAFIERESWWAGWSDFRDQVATFFSDPLGWLESRFTDWFLGPEV